MSFEIGALPLLSNVSSSDILVNICKIRFSLFGSTHNMLWLYANRTESGTKTQKTNFDDWMLMTEKYDIRYSLSYINEAKNYHFIYALKNLRFFVIFFFLSFNSITEPNSLYIYVLWYVFCYVHWVCLSLCVLVNPIIFQCWKMKKIMIEILFNFVLDFW